MTRNTLDTAHPEDVFNGIDDIFTRIATLFHRDASWLDGRFFVRTREGCEIVVMYDSGDVAGGQYSIYPLYVPFHNDELNPAFVAALTEIGIRGYEEQADWRWTDATKAGEMRLEYIEGEDTVYAIMKAFSDFFDGTDEDGVDMHEETV